MGKFSLKRVANVLARPASDEVQLITEPDEAWRAWATDLGFSYALDGSEFEGGRYFEAVPDRHGMGEQCYGVVRGSWNDQPFTYFVRKTWNMTRRHGTRPQFAGALLIELPGTPRADVLGLTPAAAFKAAGGELPNTGTFEWRAPDLLFGRGHWLDTAIVGGILQQITLQLSVAPANLWQS
jgi:hypothetical protein